MASNGLLSIGQINLQRSRLATLEALRVMTDLQIDIMLIQEQYTRLGKTPINYPGAVLEIGTAPGAGVLVNTSVISPLLLAGLSNEYQTCVSLNFGNTEITLISVYFKYGNPVGPHILSLTRALNALKGRNIVIGGDFNARSPLWFDSSSNRTERSDAVEDLIAAQGLCLINEPGNFSTFSNTHGESNIDLTLCSGSVAAKITKWMVHECAITSDHRLITFTVGVKKTEAPRSSWNFKTHRANWDNFGEALRDTLRGFHDVAARDPDNLGNFFNAAVVSAAESALGRSNPKTIIRTPWWSSELTLLKGAYKRAYRALGISRRGGCTQEETSALRGRLRCARRSFKTAVLAAKRAAWHNWVKDVGNANPWDIHSAVEKTGKGSDRYLTSVIDSDDRDAESADVASTLKTLLGKLVPLDSVIGESDHHQQIRNLSRLPPRNLTQENRMTPVSKAEIELIIKGLDPKKAPGHDRLNGIIAKQVWVYAKEELFQVMETCMRRGVFPSVWKKGVLRIIPKGNDKPRTDVKAYRPITLLPVLGKILEKLIRNRLRETLSPPYERQFGFVPGMSTEHAIKSALDWVKVCTKRYVIGIFLDITGAFDHAWWQMILTKTKNRNCPRELFNITCDYFDNRTIELSYGDVVIVREVDMGCPQGSIVGPDYWNIKFDDSSRLPLPEGCISIDYADDKLYLVSGDSRKEVESKAEEGLSMILNWGERNRLTFAPHKTVGLLMKGSLSRGRNPHIKMGDTSIRFVENTTYLGVTLDRSSSFLAHVKSVSSKAQALFMKLRRISTTEWGLRSPALRLLYRGVYVAQVSYAASVWEHRLQNALIISVLKRSQRIPLLALSGAYRTVASDALPVLAGALPIDLEIREVLTKKCLTRGRPATHHGIELIPGGAVSLPGLLRVMRERTLREWQERWDRSNTGRWTYSFFPSVKLRMEGAYITKDHYVTQLLSGHGEFRGRLHSLALSPHPNCACGDTNQTAEHILWHCEIMTDAREEMLDGLQVVTRPVWNADLVSNKVNFECLRKFTRVWVERWPVLRVDD